MTLHKGYALGRHESLEELAMGGDSVLSLKVTGQQSNGLVTVLSGVVTSGGPPLHQHGSEDEVVICVEGQLRSPTRSPTCPEGRVASSRS